MPLQQGSSRKTIQENIKQLIKEGYKQDQAIAIAIQESQKHKSRRKK
jgi:hypothetical protein